MLLSSRVIKNKKIIEQEEKKIITSDITINHIEEKLNNNDKIDSKINILGEEIIKAAKEKANNILRDAQKKAKDIEEKAYNSGYKTGKSFGYEEGIKKGNNEAKKYLEVADKKANEIILYAKKEYQNYLHDKKDEIKNMILNITEKILKKKINEEDAIDNMIFEVLENSKRVKTFIIKCNENNFEELKSKVDFWKTKLPYKAEFFIIKDEDVKLGSAVIEKDNGKIIVGIELAFEKIKKIVEES